MTSSGPAQGHTIGIDVVHLGRLDRMHDEFGGLVQARLWHPDEQEAARGMNPAGRRRYLAASLAVKEAWIKTAGRRPAGWVFSDASLVRGAAIADGAAVMTAAFAGDLGTPDPQAGILIATRSGPAGRTEHHACFAVRGEWLIAGVMS